MKFNLSVVFISLLFGCSDIRSISLINTSSSSLMDQPLVINRSDFNLNDDDFLLFLKKDKSPMPVQFDDLNGDGIWDEMAIQLSFESSQELRLNYTVISKDELPQFQTRTAAHLGNSPNRNDNFESITENIRPADHVPQSKPYLYQYEGPGWESEMVAFRAYFDTRNGKDIFGKVQPDMVVHKIGLNEDYHKLQDWGMDVLKVGNSLGAGAIAILKNDSIYGLTITENARFRILTQGPVRTVIQFDYTGWEVADSKYDLIETISIWAGKRNYESVLTLNGTGQDTLVTGIVNLKEMEAKSISGLNSKMLYSHGVQSENKDVLGMGLVVPESGFISFENAPESGDGVTNTFTALLKPVNGAYQYAFYAGWELENPVFKTEEDFVEALKKETISFINPIEIKTE